VRVDHKGIVTIETKVASVMREPVHTRFHIDDGNSPPQLVQTIAWVTRLHSPGKRFMSRELEALIGISSRVLRTSHGHEMVEVSH
jgi:hypothetical protein